MASLGKAMFKGDSGKQYRFKVFPLGTRFRKISGIYLIAYRAHGSHGGHRHKILYVGHTEDFSQPFDEAPQGPGSRATRGQLHLRSVGRVGGVSSGKGAGPRCHVQSRVQ